MAKLTDPAFIARQIAAERREFEKALEAVAVLENILNLPASACPDIKAALRRLRNLQAQAAQKVKNFDPASEAGQQNPFVH